jgi:signal transduction histidine kinase
LRHQTFRQQDLLKGLITAQEDERKRVARELHDELGQSLSGLALHLEAAQQFVETDPERALEQLSLTREMINTTTQKMYELILALRPSVLDDLGLAAALRSLARRVLPADRFVFTLESGQLKERLQPSIETALYRIFQEAMSNIVRHSAAERVNITLAQRDGVFEGEISDNGKGIDLQAGKLPADSPRGLGILGMQERVAQVGGTLEIRSRPGEGTRISIKIPLGESDHE